MIGGVTIQNDDWGKAKPKIKQVDTFYKRFSVNISKHLSCVVYYAECHANDDGVS